MTAGKAIFTIITLVLFPFFGFLIMGWPGIIAGIVLWLIAAGSIGITKDIEKAAESKE